MRFCKNCGSEVSEQAAFCTNCGSTLPLPGSESAPATESSTAPKHESNSNSTNNSYKHAFASEPTPAPVAEPVPTPAPEPTPAPVPDSVPAPAPQSIPAPIPANVKLCPFCGSQCNINAVICVHCGQKLSSESGKSNSISVPKNSNKIVSVISIILVAIGILSTLVNTIAYETFNFSTLVSLAASVVILVGFIKGNCNKLPGIGYILSALSSIVSLIILESDITFFFILAIIQTGMTAALYLGSNSIRKLWFVPIALSAISMIINYIPVFDSYYFGFDDFIVVVSSVIGAIIGSLFVCLNAKLNWNAPENTAEMPTQY